MANALTSIYAAHKHFWSVENIKLFLQSCLLFILAIVIQRVAYNYVDNKVNGTPVGDLVLDNIPTVNLDFFIVQGALVLTFVVLVFLLLHPKYLPFSIKTLSLFIIIRSFFISLTHLGVSLHQITLNTKSIGFGLYDILYYGKNDFFFSGHVGASFLCALLFWKEPFWRNFFIAASVVFASSMLLAHMHYSIDIFAAPFITYGIYALSRIIFKKDFQFIK